MKYKGYEDTNLIPDLQGWKDLNGEDYGIEDWIGMHIQSNLTIGYSAIFCPEFEEVLGCIFLKNMYKDKEIVHMMDKYYEGDSVWYQSIENYRYIVDFLYFTVDEPTNPAQVEFIGKLLEKIWGYQLKAEFPHLDTVVKYYGLDINSLDEANITFWAEPKVID